MQDHFENTDVINTFYQYCSAFPKIVIYGAGEAGQMLAEFMEQENIPLSYFCITENSGKHMQGNYEIRTIDEVMASGTDVGIVVAVSKKIVGDILQLLDSRNVQYFYDPEFLFQLFLKRCKERISKISIQDGYIDSVLDQNLDRGTLYLCCPASVGDTLYVASFVKAYKEEHPTVRRVCLVLKEAHKELGKLFPAVDKVMVSNEIIQAFDWYSIYTQTWKLNNYLYGHFRKNIRFEYDPKNNREDCRTILPRYRKLILDLSEKAELEDMVLGDHHVQAEWLENCVVLMPYAKTARMLQDFFWEELAQRLSKEGFVVYTNVSGEKEKPIRGTMAMRELLLDTALFCENCRAVVSLRSGLCDLLGFTRTKLIVVNPSKWLVSGWNLKDVFYRDGIYNIDCFEEEQYEEKLNEIMNIMDEMK